MIISYRISLLFSIRLDFDNVYASDTPTIIAMTRSVALCVKTQISA